LTLDYVRRASPPTDRHRSTGAEIQQFSTSVHAIVDGLGKQAVQIESAKLKVR